MGRITWRETDEYGDTATYWFDADRAESVEGRREWDGQNQADVHVGANRGENLWHTAQGRYVVEFWSKWDTEPDTYRYITAEQARDWLLLNESEEELERWFGEVEEERGPGRPEIGPAFSVRFPADLLEWVDRRAEQDGTSRAAIVREATVRFLNEMDRQPGT